LKWENERYIAYIMQPIDLYNDYPKIPYPFGKANCIITCFGVSSELDQKIWSFFDGRMMTCPLAKGVLEVGRQDFGN